MQIANTAALVTGGASGLGLATVERLAGTGATVTIVDLPSSDGKAIAERLGANVRFHGADVTDEDGVKAALDVATSATDGGAPLRIVVNCAGIGTPIKVLGKDGPFPLDAFRKVVEVNLVGSFNVLRLGAERIAATEPVDGERGVIISTASVAAFEGQIGQTSYAASKGGVRAITIVAARDLASWGIRVNTIAPGTMDTPMLARLRDDIRQQLAESIPHPRRLGTSDDFAHMAVSLIENEYVNGHVVRLDGAIRMAPR